MSEKSLTKQEPQVSAFSSLQAFEGVQRMATLLSKSDMVPAQYKENLPNCVIALEMANRMGASVFAVMQNLAIVHGKPSWEAKFIIGAINSCGRFSPLRFEMSGEGDDYGCYCWAYDKRDKERLNGPRVTIGMAKLEGWYQKNGSKWKSIPDLMLRYRAASFFGKLYAADILMGMQTVEELRDVFDAEPAASGEYEVRAEPQTRTESVMEKLKRAAKGPEAPRNPQLVKAILEDIRNAKTPEELAEAEDMVRELQHPEDRLECESALEEMRQP